MPFARMHSAYVAKAERTHRTVAVEDPLMRLVRQRDTLIDELAKGKPTGEILRG